MVDSDDPRELARAVGRLSADPRLRAALRSGGLVTAAAHDGARSNLLLERMLFGEVRLAGRRRSRGPARDGAGRSRHVAA